ncbi:MAG: signal peptidase I, partial [bacterium]
DHEKHNAVPSIGFWGRRKIRKLTLGLLRHSSYVRSMRVDIADRAALARLDEEAAELRRDLKSKRYDRLESRLESLSAAAEAVMPLRSMATCREYVEIVVVALAVAMACRSYFLQPFKIPTGSMQPTLNGITYRDGVKTPVVDTIYPLKVARFLVLGEWYTEIRASRPGQILFCDAANERQRVPDATRNGCFTRNIRIAIGSAWGPRVFENMRAHVKDQDYVVAGQLLASGYEMAGDHVFVDRVSWNFRQPRRSEVMVFLTTGIHKGLPKDTHYIKRMVGIPGDTLSVTPPWLSVNGSNVTEYTIGKIGRGDLGNGGYALAAPSDGWPITVLNATNPSIQLRAGQYLAMGDNTRSSLDSRYWGPVPRERLVGPAAIVYWPFTKRWGLIGR